MMLEKRSRSFYQGRYGREQVSSPWKQNDHNRSISPLYEQQVFNPLDSNVIINFPQTQQKNGNQHSKHLSFQSYQKSPQARRIQQFQRVTQQNPIYHNNNHSNTQFNAVKQQMYSHQYDSNYLENQNITRFSDLAIKSTHQRSQSPYQSAKKLYVSKKRDNSATLLNYEHKKQSYLDEFLHKASRLQSLSQSKNSQQQQSQQYTLPSANINQTNYCNQNTFNISYENNNQNVSNHNYHFNNNYQHKQNNSYSNSQWDSDINRSSKDCNKQTKQWENYFNKNGQEQAEAQYHSQSSCGSSSKHLYPSYYKNQPLEQLISPLSSHAFSNQHKEINFPIQEIPTSVLEEKFIHKNIVQMVPILQYDEQQKNQINYQKRIVNKGPELQNIIDELKDNIVTFQNIKEQFIENKENVNSLQQNNNKLLPSPIFANRNYDRSSSELNINSNINYQQFNANKEQKQQNTLYQNEVYAPSSKNLEINNENCMQNDQYHTFAQGEEKLFGQFFNNNNQQLQQNQQMERSNFHQSHHNHHHHHQQSSQTQKDLIQNQNYMNLGQLIKKQNEKNKKSHNSKENQRNSLVRIPQYQQTSEYQQQQQKQQSYYPNKKIGTQEIFSSSEQIKNEQQQRNLHQFQNTQYPLLESKQYQLQTHEKQQQQQEKQSLSQSLLKTHSKERNGSLLLQQREQNESKKLKQPEQTLREYSVSSQAPSEFATFNLQNYKKQTQSQQILYQTFEQKQELNQQTTQLLPQVIQPNNFFYPQQQIKQYEQEQQLSLEKSKSNNQQQFDQQIALFTDNKYNQYLSLLPSQKQGDQSYDDKYSSSNDNDTPLLEEGDNSYQNISSNSSSCMIQDKEDKSYKQKIKQKPKHKKIRACSQKDVEQFFENSTSEEKVEQSYQEGSKSPSFIPQTKEVEKCVPFCASKSEFSTFYQVNNSNTLKQLSGQQSYETNDKILSDQLNISSSKQIVSSFACFSSDQIKKYESNNTSQYENTEGIKGISDIMNCRNNIDNLSDKDEVMLKTDGNDTLSSQFSSPQTTIFFNKQDNSLTANSPSSNMKIDNVNEHQKIISEFTIEFPNKIIQIEQNKQEQDERIVAMKENADKFTDLNSLILLKETLKFDENNNPNEEIFDISEITEIEKMIKLKIEQAEKSINSRLSFEKYKSVLESTSTVSIANVSICAPTDIIKSTEEKNQKQILSPICEKSNQQVEITQEFKVKQISQMQTQIEDSEKNQEIFPSIISVCENNNSKENIEVRSPIISSASSLRSSFNNNSFSLKRTSCQFTKSSNSISSSIHFQKKHREVRLPNQSENINSLSSNVNFNAYLKQHKQQLPQQETTVECSLQPKINELISQQPSFSLFQEYVLNKDSFQDHENCLFEKPEYKSNESKDKINQEISVQNNIGQIGNIQEKITQQIDKIDFNIIIPEQEQLMEVVQEMKEDQKQQLQEEKQTKLEIKQIRQFDDLLSSTEAQKLHKEELKIEVNSPIKESQQDFSPPFKSTKYQEFLDYESQIFSSLENPLEQIRENQISGQKSEDFPQFLPFANPSSAQLSHFRYSNNLNEDQVFNNIESIHLNDFNYSNSLNQQIFVNNSEFCKVEDKQNQNNLSINVKDSISYEQNLISEQNLKSPASPSDYSRNSQRFTDDAQTEALPTQNPYEQLNQQIESQKENQEEVAFEENKKKNLSEDDSQKKTNNFTIQQNNLSELKIIKIEKQKEVITDKSPQLKEISIVFQNDNQVNQVGQSKTILKKSFIGSPSSNLELNRQSSLQKSQRRISFKDKIEVNYFQSHSNNRKTCSRSPMTKRILFLNQVHFESMKRQQNRNKQETVDKSPLVNFNEDPNSNKQNSEIVADSSSAHQSSLVRKARQQRILQINDTASTKSDGTSITPTVKSSSNKTGKQGKISFLEYSKIIKQGE